MRNYRNNSDNFVTELDDYIETVSNFVGNRPEEVERIQFLLGIMKDYCEEKGLFYTSYFLEKSSESLSFDEIQLLKN